jgi:TPR repeat protein
VKTRTVLAALLAAFIPVMTLAASGKGIAAFKAGRYDQATKILTPEAQAGDAEAQYYLAYALRFSLPKPKGEVRAYPSESDPGQQEIHRWLEKAAFSGHSEATLEYALDFDAGAGVAPDFDQALKWMQKAFDLGDKGARGKLINWYDSGHIVAPSYQKFRELDAVNAESNAKMRDELQQFRKTIEAAGVYVESADAMLYKNDPAAAEDGDPRAARRLAEGATYARDPAKQDCAAAQRYYLLAGDAGDPRAYHDLGVQFYRGHCQQQDFARARELFTKSAEGADKLAVYDLAEMNLFGHGQTPDYPAAYYWLKVLEALDPAWLRSEPSMLIVAKRKMSAAEIAAADARVAAQSPVILAVQKRTQEKITRRPIKSAGDPASASAWSYDLALLDESGMCSSNVRGNCDHVPFEIQIAIRNPAPASLDCKLALVMKRPGEKEAVTYQRHYVLFPEDELKPRIGRVAGRVDVPASGMDCTPVTNPSVADQTCAMRLLPGTNIEDFLQGSAARRKKQGGRITLELMFSALKGKPANVTVKQSSGFAELDEVAIKYASATSFRTNCTNAPIPMTIAVE